MKRWLPVLLCLCLMWLPTAAPAMEGAYLDMEDLQALEGTFEAFLQALADILIARGLLSEGEREAWLLYQLGDYYQNGGYGSMLISYTPGLLHNADEAVTMRRFTQEVDVGVIRLDTLRRYTINYSPLPGLPLDTELTDPDGAPIPCRFRWTATGGSFLIWDGVLGEVVNVGATFVSDGRPLYWYEEPSDGIDETLYLDVLYEEEDATLASVMVKVVSGPDYWMPEEMQ